MWRFSMKSECGEKERAFLHLNQYKIGKIYEFYSWLA